MHSHSTHTLSLFPPHTLHTHPLLTLTLHTLSLLTQVLAERDTLTPPPPLLVKIAPDLTQQDKQDIAAVITREKVRQSVLTE